MKNFAIIVLALCVTSNAFALEFKTGQGPTASQTDVTSGYYYLAQFGGVAKTNTVYVNVEDRDESYKCWSAIRFDVSDFYANAAATAPKGIVIDKITLSLWETTPFWGRQGNVEVRYTADDAVDIESPTSDLVMYNPPLDPVNGQLADGSGDLIKEIPYYKQSGYPEIKHELYNGVAGNSGTTKLYDDLMDTGDNAITFALVDDGHVKAGWVGATSTYWYERPQLSIEYHEVPEPATVGLLAIGGLFGLLRRKK